jgi:hypothetical protein
MKQAENKTNEPQNKHSCSDTKLEFLCFSGRWFSDEEKQIRV